jgi:hypothetical protein
MFRDFRHIGEKVRVVHNVQQDETMEDMGRNAPRIYASLDNKKAEYQSQMIEVEGMFNNQTIVILIDSGASHSYIDPNMVETFHLPRRKHENLGWCSWIPEPKEKLMRWVGHVLRI